jgi:hypothetical protein
MFGKIGIYGELITRIDSPPSPLSAAQRGGVEQLKAKTLFPRSGERVVKRSDDRVSKQTACFTYNVFTPLSFGEGTG